MSSDNKAIAEAERAGFDLSLIDSNLRLTHDERALRHAAALHLALALRAAGEKHAKSAPATKPAR